MRPHRATKKPVLRLKPETSIVPRCFSIVPRLLQNPDFKLTLTILHLDFKSVMMPTINHHAALSFASHYTK
jgi:hypothetical protein